MLPITRVGISLIVLMSSGDSGDLDLPLTRGLAVTFEAFSPTVSTQFAASLAHPEAILRPADVEPIDLGTLGLDIYSATARTLRPRRA